MRCTLLILLLSFIWSSNSAQDVLTLNQAIRIGLNNNFGLQIADQRTAIAKGQRMLYEADMLPRINIQLRQNNLFEIDNSPTSFVDGNYSQNSVKAVVDADWTLFDGFRTRFEKDRLEQLEFRAAGNAQLFVENTTQAIILGYYKALLEAQQQSVIEEVTQLSKDRFEQGQMLLQSGSKSQFEVLSLENAWLKDSISFLGQQLNSDLAMDDLKFLMGVGDENEYTLEDELIADFQSYDLETLDANLIANNRDLRLQYLNLTVLDLERGKLKSDRYPKVRLTSSLSQDVNSSRFKDEDRITGSTFDFYAGFTVDYKLYNGGRIKKLLDEHDIKDKIANLEVEQMEYRLKDELRDTYHQYENYRNVIAKEQLLLINLQQTLDIAKERLDGGYAIPLEYRNTQLEYLNANIDLLKSIFKLKSAELILMKLTGGLSSSAF